MDIQSVIVGLLVIVAVFYLARKYYRAAKKDGGCGCGCGSGCPAEKHSSTSPCSTSSRGDNQ